MKLRTIYLFTLVSIALLLAPVLLDNAKWAGIGGVKAFALPKTSTKIIYFSLALVFTLYGIYESLPGILRDWSLFRRPQSLIQASIPVTSGERHSSEALVVPPGIAVVSWELIPPDKPISEDTEVFVELLNDTHLWKSSEFHPMFENLSQDNLIATYHRNSWKCTLITQCKAGSHFASQVLLKITYQ